ncbi:MAG TPA: hypothetical protein DEG47_17390, partial [Cyanobacteria bacterium UBA11148]|nr:hypothetical protein [Cyanobacteria bacterium UBA11148]
CDKGLQVLIVGATQKVKHRLEKLGISALVPPQNFLSDRKEALQQGLDWVRSKGVERSDPMSDPLSGQLPMAEQF